jgi:hypothetical protein
LMSGTETLPEDRLWEILRSTDEAGRAGILADLPSMNGQQGTRLPSFKELRYAKKIEFLKRLNSAPRHGSPKFMDWDQLRTMQQAGITFGSHTVNHAILPNEDLSTVSEELQRSRQQMHTELGHPPEHFGGSGTSSRLQNCSHHGDGSLSSGI